ncbi:MAG TPA: DUF998 domain-containing protein [Candidatus Deferrimicrobium sp.]|nr:DUF998 domain-containing protein [Candidatus Deferrimicrobium sp.]
MGLEHAPSTGRPEPLLWGGVLGPLLFVAVFVIDGAMRAGYDPLRHQVSYLSLGEGGWVQVASFLATGALVLAFAIGLRRALGDGPGAVGAPVSIAVVGAGLLVAGAFPTVPAFGFPPGTPDAFPTDIPATAYLHVVGAILFFGGMVGAALLMARQFRAAGEAAWTTFSIASAVAVVVFFAASSADPSGRPFVPALAGLLQRLSIVAGLGWIAALAVSSLRRSPR